MSALEHSVVRLPFFDYRYTLAEMIVYCNYQPGAKPRMSLCIRIEYRKQQRQFCGKNSKVEVFWGNLILLSQMP